jgi:hypothetical protein
MAIAVYPTVALAGTSPTMKLDVVESANADLSSPTVLGSVSGLTSAPVGKVIEVPIPQGVMTKKYIGLQVTLGGTTPTITLDAYLVPQDEIAKYKSFPKVNHAAL